MIIQELKENWRLKNPEGSLNLTADFPCSVISVLQKEGKIADPFFGDNERSVAEETRKDYIFTCEFDAQPGLLSSENVILRFEGVDTIAGVTLNHMEVGKMRNMHRCYEFPVKKLLTAGKNYLEVRLSSAEDYIERAYQADPVDGCDECAPGFVHLRKAHYMFGWDWGPKLPDAGIFKPVTLVGINKARLTGVRIKQVHEKVGKQTRVTLSVFGRALVNGETVERPVEKDLRLIYSVIDPKGRMLVDGEDNDMQTIIENAMLWWPNGYGEQPLYTIKVELTDFSGRVLDSYTEKIGLRSMTVNTAKDSYGNKFAHVVNGTEIFAMGADYIPEDNLLPRIKRERTEKLLRACKEANFNCIRVWGGGFYPEDYFYELCDELGLIVWQDFMFACGHYRLTKYFEDTVTAEIRENVRRIRNHACIGLFCGNNEMELFVKEGKWNVNDSLKADYTRLYEELIPAILKKEAPDVFYWPSSPSSGGKFDEPNAENRGDAHFWDVWHQNKPFSEYRNHQFRYLSEFGFQSLPSLKTIESFAVSDEITLHSLTMESHQKNASANNRLTEYIAQMYPQNSSFSAIIYESQLLQAEAIRYGVEHFRRNRGCCMGTMFWQLNDCWPGITWSAIDYYGRRKALYYFAKRFFAPILLSAEETSVTGPAAETSVRLCVTNETMIERKVVVYLTLRNAKSDVLSEKRMDITVPALSSLWLDKEVFADVDEKSSYVSYRLAEAVTGAELSCGTVLFCAPKDFAWEDPQLSVRVNGNKITVTSTGFAKGVHLFNKNDDLVLSDNFFDMNRGEKTVTVLSGSVDGTEVESVYGLR